MVMILDNVAIPDYIVSRFKELISAFVSGYMNIINLTFFNVVIKQ